MKGGAAIQNSGGITSMSAALLGWFDEQFMSAETLPPWVRSNPRTLFLRGVAETLFSALLIFWAIYDPDVMMWFLALLYSAITAWTFRTWIWIRT
jgi:ABC-type multidrug transport system permease subunit